MDILAPVALIGSVVGLVIGAVCIGVSVYLVVLVIRALRTYIRSHEVRQEKAETRRSLGEVLKSHRTGLNMTQEFVAEALGVSKWESGASDPSTSNLMALAKLFGVPAEDLLREASGQ